MNQPKKCEGCHFWYETGSRCIYGGNETFCPIETNIYLNYRTVNEEGECSNVQTEYFPDAEALYNRVTELQHEYGYGDVYDNNDKILYIEFCKVHIPDEHT